MSFTRYCDGPLRQPCPTPHSCHEECQFDSEALDADEPSDWCDMQEIAAGVAMAVLLMLAAMLLGLVLAAVVR